MRTFIFLSIFLCSFILQGQIDSTYYYTEHRVDYLKHKVYSSIILSDELKSNKKCRVAVIPSISIGSEPMVNKFFTKPILKKDSISLQRLRQNLPTNYWTYEVEFPLVYINRGRGFINDYYNSDTLYVKNKLENIDKRYGKFQNLKSAYQVYHCEGSFDIIKIYEPFDKWIGLYSQYNDNEINAEVVIPVKYESLTDGNMFSGEKEKYMLFKFKIKKDILEPKYEVVSF